MAFSVITYFNSIKVRLEHDVFSTSDTANIFQFHKGTIRTRAGTTVLELLPNFNSIKVRLEQRKLVKLLRANKFQFHKGTIRTVRVHLL